MKTVFLCFVLFIGIYKVWAQEMESIIEVPAQKQRISVEDESRQLQRTLLLNEGQYIKVNEINKERRKTLDQIQSMYSREPEKRDLKIEEIELQYDAEFAAVFTKRQLKEYLELHGRSENAPVKQAQTEAPSFDKQIHTIIEKVLTPVLDSAQLAVQDSVKSDSLSANQGVSKENSRISQVIDPNQNISELSDEKIMPFWEDEEGVGNVEQNNLKIQNAPQDLRLKIESLKNEMQMKDQDEKNRSNEGLKYEIDEDEMKLQTTGDE